MFYSNECCIVPLLYCCACFINVANNVNTLYRFCYPREESRYNTFERDVTSSEVREPLLSELDDNVY